jgi:hypothetical protein
MIGFYFENENYHPSPLEKDRTVTRLCLVDEANLNARGGFKNHSQDASENGYSILNGNNCVGSVQDGLKAGGFNYNNKLEDGTNEKRKCTRKVKVTIFVKPIEINLKKGFDWSVQWFDERLLRTAERDKKEKKKRVEGVTTQEKKDTGSFLKSKYGGKKKQK